MTPSYGPWREDIVKLLNEALATEIVCVLRYKRHYFMATGIHAQAVAAEFLEHANEEQAHADQIAERIVQLGGEPNFSPEGLPTRSHAEYVERLDLRRHDQGGPGRRAHRDRDLLRDDPLIGDNDPTTRRMLEDILGQEEEHADELQRLAHALGFGPRRWGPFESHRHFVS